MAIRTVTSGGSVTIPKEVRDDLMLNPGDCVDFVRDGTGRFQVRKGKVDTRKSIAKSGPPVRSRAK